ncbi:MAG: acyl-CoA dehydrogenase family protein [Acidimicrobiia bacterium]
MERDVFEAEHDMFRSSIREFFEREAVPNIERWEKEGVVDRELFLKAGAAGFLGIDLPEEHGGGGTRDFRYNQIINEEVQRAGLGGSGLGITLHNDICVPYFRDLTNDEQKSRWLPGICSGELITAIAMTEPGTGSDLANISTTAIRDGDYYLVNGSKTFITNGINADLVITAVKTDATQKHRGMSLLVIERDTPGFSRGRNLEKIGMHAQDTAELAFSDARVPVANLLGAEGEGFKLLMTNLAQERLSIAVAGVAAAKAALDWSVEYTKERQAFGAPISSFQNTRFALATLATEVEVGQSFIDRCVALLNQDRLSAEDAAMAKWWCTELQGRAVDQGVQLHGGYGYMTEYPIARAYMDARITRIYGGTTEIMKEIISRSL